MDELRILIVSPGHPAMVPGSAEISAYDLFCELDQSDGVDAIFLACVEDQGHPSPRGGALQKCEGSRNEYLLHVDGFDSFMMAHSVDSGFLGEFGRLLDTLKPDIVHFHHLQPIGAESLAIVRNRLPYAGIVFTLHDFHPICHRGGLMVKTWTNALCDRAESDDCNGCFGDISPSRFSLRRDHMQNLLGLVDRFIVASEVAGERFAGWGIPRPLIEHIHLGLPDAVQTDTNSNSQIPNRFGYFGNIMPHKGPLLLLKALQRIPPAVDLTLKLYGSLSAQDDTFARSFEQALEICAGRARYMGPYSRRNVGHLMGEVDWVIVPSGWWENSPLTILEAFRAGRPVIAANVGGMAENVEHGRNGLLFSHNDASDLAKVIQSASGDQDYWQCMADSLPAVPAMAEVAARHLAIYDDLSHVTNRRRA